LDGDELPKLNLEGGKFTYFPVAIFQYGFGCYDLYLQTKDKRYDCKFMQCVEWTLVQQQQVVIPQTAVNFTLYGQTVYVVEDGKDAKGQPVKIAKQTVVNVAERDADVAHVVSGLKVGDVVVTSGQIRLSNGSQVKAVEDNTLAKPATVPAL
jgi:hypothetical protein